MATELRRTPSAVYNMLKSYANCGLLAAVSCTKVHNVSGNKYKFAQIVQETNTKTTSLDSCYIIRFKHVIADSVRSLNGS